MIKLIASDLDGTLFPPHTCAPPEGTFELIEKLYNKGILFVPASGRQLPDILKIFAPVLDKIAIIAENGGLIWYMGEIIYSNPTPKEGVEFALEVIGKAEGMYPLLSCADCAYYESDNEAFIKVVKRSYSSCKKVENLHKIAAEKQVVKISVWYEKPPCAEHGGPTLQPALTGLRTIVSGYDWLDVSCLNANKGEALKALLKKLEIMPVECEAYGDHMNDYEMLSVCGNPFVTANAFKGLKDKFKNELPSNAEGGVIIRLKEHL